MSSSFLSYLDMKKMIEAVRKEGQRAVVYLPAGCMEQHGPFLPLETDSLIAEAFARDLCLEMRAKKYWGYVYPTVHYSPTRSNADFCGTVSVDEEHFRSYIRQICRSLLTSPFDAVVIVSGHGPADPSLREIGFQLVNEQFRKGMASPTPVVVLSIADLSSQAEKQFNQKSGKHADWRELLMVYRLLGEKYFDDAMVRDIKKFKENNVFENTGSLICGIPIELRSTDGVIGEPVPEGEREWKLLADDMWAYLLQAVSTRLFKDIESHFSKWPPKRD